MVRFDILYFKPMTDLYINHKTNRSADTVICYSDSYKVYPIGFLMSSPGNAFYNYIFTNSLSFLDPKEYQSIGYQLLKKQFPDPQLIEEKFTNLKIINLALEVVYPLNHNMIYSIFYSNNLNYLTPNTLGLHWYAGHIEAGRFENLINEKNHSQFNNILSYLIAKIVNYGQN